MARMSNDEPSSAYVSKTPGPDGLIAYTDEENGVWRDLFARQMRLLEGRVVPAFLEGVEKLALPHDRVPQLAHVDAALQKISGFGVASVPALISPKRFFTLLSDRRFPAATFIRRREDFDYIEEPDVFHELFGHCPLLTIRDYADYLQRYGQIALSLPEKHLWRLQRLFWFTVEFGLIRKPDGIKIYGAGIVSSAKETPWALEEPSVKRESFDLVTVLRTPYRIDILQPLYYVIESYEQLLHVIDQDLPAAIEEAKRLGALEPLFPPKDQAA
jgi:phenylalanine-4-hydroxylase